MHIFYTRTHTHTYTGVCMPLFPFFAAEAKKKLFFYKSPNIHKFTSMIYQKIFFV